MAKRKKSIVPLGLRLAVIERDKSTCQYCGKIGIPSHYRGRVCEIQTSSDYDNNKFNIEISFEIDHVVPEFIGGKTNINNLKLSCRKCNRGKGWKR